MSDLSKFRAWRTDVDQVLHAPKYRNHKNGLIYAVLQVGGDCTGGRESEQVVHYVPLGNINFHCFRELSEFNVKFSRVDNNGNSIQEEAARHNTAHIIPVPSGHSGEGGKA